MQCMRRLGIVIVTAMVTLMGCSSQLGYRFADTFIAWQVDDYVTLNSTQDDLLMGEIKTLHYWHATSELPRYRNSLLMLRDAIATQTFDETTFANLTQDAWYFWDRVREQTLPLALQHLPKLTPGQVDELTNNMQVKIDERAERRAERLAEMTPDERVTEQRDELEGDVREWIGRLSAKQRGIVADWVAAQQANGELWLAYRQAWLDEFKAVLKAGPQSADYTTRIETLIRHPQTFESPELTEIRAANSKVNQTYTLIMYQTLSERQRARVLEQLDDYLADLDDIIAEFEGRDKPEN